MKSRAWMWNEGQERLQGCYQIQRATAFTPRLHWRIWGMNNVPKADDDLFAQDADSGVETICSRVSSRPLPSLPKIP